MNKFFDFLKSLVGLGGGSLQSPEADPNVPWKAVAFFPGDPEPHHMPDISPVDAAAMMIRERLRAAGANPDQLRIPDIDFGDQ